ncbi:aminotransferase class I/II-fold pyridoxal phosphate-dependent enzyme [Salinimicrobium gaetbulicola]|uniref:Aminotransferase class I/II-fold pyridoxal phosphate-dependent enzyme n=1 Tax=Salinimicrobium gaetbulicola TaxID=999702 RepID=A0ABW3IHN7_9FLAO
MKKFPLKLDKSLQFRKEQKAFRELSGQKNLVDFSSNDYLGLAKNNQIFENAHRILVENDILKNGGTGSRLLSGNHALYGLAEEKLKYFFNSEAALIYNSGYDANLGFFSSVPQRNDIVFYDELSHASIRDGINLGKAKAYKFFHNDHEDLEQKIIRIKKTSIDAIIYIVTEAVFSMDGDMPDLRQLAEISEKYGCFLVVDEAHSVGVIGETGKGLVEELGVSDHVFARLVTFGKALGAHGAAILGSRKLKDYLINFSRSLIYTTSLPPHSVATILAAIQFLETDGVLEILKLQNNIQHFNSELEKRDLEPLFIKGNSAIYSCVVPGNEKVKQVAFNLQLEGFDVKPILSPTVPEGKERLRFCLHSFNSEEELNSTLTVLKKEILS